MNKRQWTASSIQNELLAILSDMTLELILNDVRLSKYFAVIMDETSDIGRSEQVSLCLSYLLESEKNGEYKGVATRMEEILRLYMYIHWRKYPLC